MTNPNDIRGTEDAAELRRRTDPEANPDELRANWQEDRRWTPSWNDDQRAAGYAGWRKAVERTLDWVDDDTDALFG